jgi:hypothetical protein
MFMFEWTSNFFYNFGDFFEINVIHKYHNENEYETYSMWCIGWPEFGLPFRWNTKHILCDVLAGPSLAYPRVGEEVDGVQMGSAISMVALALSFASGKSNERQLES